MRTTPVPLVLIPLTALSVALLGCGDEGATPRGAAVGASGSAAASPAATPGGTGAGRVGGATAPPAGGPAAAADPWARIPQIVADVQPSVVSILRDGGEGSGVVWSADGIIVTNQHVVEGVRQVGVAFADGTRSDGQVLADDALSDLAVVRTERTGLPAAEFATELPPIGSLAIALGNPLGFENSATAGIVSGTHRAVPGAAQAAPALVDLVQTDAAISPGNSGGALVGGDGRVIGINVAYIPPAARAVSIGFAIPAPTVTDVVAQLLDDGRAEHAYLGVQPATLTEQIRGQLGIEQETGALVVEVVPGSPAARAGIEAGDVIVGIDEDRVDTVEDMLGALRRRDVGAAATVHIVRAGEELEVGVTLGDFPSR